MSTELSSHKWTDKWILLYTPLWQDVKLCTCGVYNCSYAKANSRQRRKRVVVDW